MSKDLKEKLSKDPNDLKKTRKTPEIQKLLEERENLERQLEVLHNQSIMIRQRIGTISSTIHALERKARMGTDLTQFTKKINQSETNG